MKNKILTYCLLVLTAISLSMVSCQRDDLKDNGTNGEVTISVVVPNAPAVKSAENPGDGALINRCILEIYENGELYGERMYADMTPGTLTAQFSARLATDHTYTFVFWADYAEGSAETGYTELYYNTENGLSDIRLITDEYVNNNDERDAFYLTESKTITGTEALNFTLRRPSGQVSLVATDLADLPSDFDFSNITVKVGFTEVPAGFNALTGEISGERTVIDPVSFSVPVDFPTAGETPADEARASFDYIFANVGEDFTLLNLTYEFQNNGMTIASGEYDNFRILQNYRTNLKGSLFTDGVDITVNFDTMLTDLENPLGDEEELVEATIADLRKLAPANTDDKATITDGFIIKALVISNYEINNLTSLKNVFIQDETGGIQVRFTSDNTEFAFGDELEIDLSGQELSYYAGVLQVNNLPNENATVLSEGNTVEAKEVTVAEFLKGTYDAQYVSLPDIQVVEADLNKTFVMDNQHTTINVEDKDGNSFAIFSSRYSTFGDEQVPQGAGTLKGIATSNNGNIQINLTSTEDYAGMTGERFEDQGGSENPDPDTPIISTIGDFLNAPVSSDTWYQLTGTITDIENTTYGNLTIEDETGSVYIYGLTETKVTSNDKSFKNLGLEVGDIITIATLRGEYGGEPQGGGNPNPAYLIAHESGQGGGDTPEPGEIEEVTVEEFLAKAEGETYYKLTGTVTNINNASWGNLTIEDESGDVYVYGVAKDEASVGSGPSFSGLGVEVGDILTIAGKRTSYNGSPQVGDAYYIIHEKGQGGGIEDPDPEPGNALGDVNVVLGEKSYYEEATINGTNYQVLKLGTSSLDGAASFTIPAGTTKMTLYCVAWNGRSGKLKLSGNCTITPSEISPASNSGASGNYPYTMTVSDSDRYEFTVSGVSSDTVINLASEGRVILWDVQLD